MKALKLIASIFMLAVGAGLLAIVGGVLWLEYMESIGKNVLQ